MGPLIFVLSVAFFIIFCVKVSTSKSQKTSTPTRYKKEKVEEVIFTVTTGRGGFYGTPHYSEDFINKKHCSLAKKRAPTINENISAPVIFLQNKEWILTLRMTESRSIGFKRTLTIIKKLPSYKEYVAEEIKNFEVTFKKENLHDFKKIYDEVKNLKGTQIFINGDLIEKTELSKLLRCAVDRSLANEDFCYGVSRWTLNPFGCHRIKTRLIGENAWYKYAYLQDGIVYIDKKKILQNLTMDLKKYRYCPYLDIKGVWNNFLMLPDIISLEDENFAVILTLDGKLDILNRWDLNYLGYTTYQELKENYGDRLLSKK